MDYYTEQRKKMCNFIALKKKRHSVIQKSHDLTSTWCKPIHTFPIIWPFTHHLTPAQVDSNRKLSLTFIFLCVKDNNDHFLPTKDQTTNKEQKELLKRSSLTLKSNSMRPKHFRLSMNLSSAAFDRGCFFLPWPLTPRDLQGPVRSYWWPLSLFHMVITAANGRLLAGLFGKNCTASRKPTWRPLSAFFFFCFGFGALIKNPVV